MNTPVASQPMTADLVALADRLLAHAEVHAQSSSPHDDEQAQWERDLREAASALRSSGEVTPPDANWCRTCGKHRNDPMAIFCNDRCHDKLHKTGTTPPTSTKA